MTGTKGDTGATGTAATVTLGSVSTGAAGSSVIITNSSGNPSAATFNFTIPRGDTGSQGIQGPSGSISGIVWEPDGMAQFAQVNASSSTGAYYRLLTCRYTFTVATARVFKLSTSALSLGIAIYNSAMALVCNGSYTWAASSAAGFTSIPMTAASGGTLSLVAGNTYYVGVYSAGLASTNMLATTVGITNVPAGTYFTIPANVSNASFGWNTNVTTPPPTISGGSMTSNGYVMYCAFSSV